MRLLLIISFVLSWFGMAHPYNVTIPVFTEQTLNSGIKSIYSGGWQYIVGGGAAAFDCNDDGFPDLFLAGGEGKAGFYHNVSTRGGPLKFTRQKSGLEFDHVTGAYPIDINGDGVTDIVILRVGENIIMRGLGKCRFERANEKWGFEGGDSWSTAFAATWEKGNDWPTVAIGNYIDRTQEISPWGTCTDNWLHRPNGQQLGFAKPFAMKPSYCALSMLFTDWNRSGTPSLRVANDREYYEGGQEQLWKLEPGKNPIPYKDTDGWKPQKFWGMGIAAADLNGDGFPDYFVSSMADQRMQLLAKDATKPTYKDAPFTMGVTAFKPYTGGDQRPSTGWHVQFEDVNNDGLQDLFIAKGNVDKMPDFAMNDPDNLLLQKPDGTFAESGDKAGVASMNVGRGAVLADFNLDGKTDLVVVNRHHRAQIWQNTSTDIGHWLGLRLQQTGGNRDAIGAWIEVKQASKIMRREITVGGGHVSGQLTWTHFGLGAITKTQLRVIWPDGGAGEWYDVAADQFYIVEKGQFPHLWKSH